MKKRNRPVFLKDEPRSFEEVLYIALEKLDDRTHAPRTEAGQPCTGHSYCALSTNITHSNVDCRHLKLFNTHVAYVDLDASAR